jgi:hypothetical protein
LRLNRALLVLRIVRLFDPRAQSSGPPGTNRRPKLGLVAETLTVMYDFAQPGDTVNLEELRERLQKMTDKELLRFGQAARFMCSTTANGNKPPRKPFVIQLKEARAEWKRRHKGAESPIGA